MKKSEVIRYFLLNFAFMLLGCLLVDLLTYIQWETANILGSLLIASIGATVCTLIRYIIEHGRKKIIQHE
jgi:hypothetical protein